MDNSSSKIEKSIMIVKNRNNDSVLSIKSSSGALLSIIINKDYRETIKEMEDLLNSGYINESLSLTSSSNLYINSILNIEMILKEAKLIIDEPILIKTYITPIPLDDLSEENLKNIPDSPDEISLSMGLHYDIDIDEESNVFAVLPRLMTQITNLILILNHE